MNQKVFQRDAFIEEIFFAAEKTAIYSSLVLTLELRLSIYFAKRYQRNSYIAEFRNRT